ncbi:MAG: hypothetical protein WCD45_03995 [Gallionella sp.]
MAKGIWQEWVGISTAQLAKTGMYAATHEDFEPRFDAVSPSAVVVHVTL